MGKKLLNKYYDKTNHSEVYRIAMVLHLQHKLQIVEDKFEKAYMDLEVIDSGESSR
ncbi:hypothetical protein C0991_004597, partial [Blastosporella zonata]